MYSAFYVPKPKKKLRSDCQIIKELGIVAHAYISSTGRLKQQDCRKFKTYLRCVVRLCFKKQRKRHYKHSAVSCDHQCLLMTSSVSLI